MSSLIKDRIDDTLMEAKHANQTQGAYSYLPAIIDTLSQMQREVHADSASRSKLAGALGRLVTEDCAFSESAFGQALLKLADEFTA